MKPFQAAFVPSRWRKMGVVFGAICLILCVMWWHFGAMRLVLILAIAASAFYAWHDHSHFVQHIDIQENDVYLTLQNETVSAKLGSGSLIAPRICFLRWQCEKRTIWQCVLPDMLPESDFRRLRLWARWCQYR